jgi:hypothetical protein
MRVSEDQLPNSCITTAYKATPTVATVLIDPKNIYQLRDNPLILREPLLVALKT